MEEFEYIKFTFNDEFKLKECNEVFKIISDCKENKTKKSESFWLKKLPKYVINYFKESQQNNSWSLKKILEFIIEDLDVTFVKVYSKDNFCGRLDYKSNGYPYGGPSSLITFLKSFDFNPIKTYEGIDVYKIIWISNFEFKYETTKSKQKGVKNLIKKFFS